MRVVLQSCCRESPRHPLDIVPARRRRGLFATIRATRIAWLADDSFVSFRYAWNLVHGHGLVYNAGERVEGYSNLLWTLLMAGGLTLGVAPEVASKALGILCWLLLVGFLALRSWRRQEGRSFMLSRRSTNFWIATTSGRLARASNPSPRNCETR